MMIEEVDQLLVTRANLQSSCESFNAAAQKHIGEVAHRMADLKAI
jgi:beta-N-acetylglucosaminidase